MHAWGKSSALNYTHQSLKMVMILAQATVKRPSDLSLLRKAPKAMQITKDSVTFQPVFEAKSARPNHPSRPTITLRSAQDEYICPVRFIKEYIGKAKGREEQSEKPFVTRKMGPALVVSKDTIAHWPKKTLTLANVRAPGGSIRKAAATHAACQGVSIRTIMEADEWAYTSMMDEHYIIGLPRGVLARILEQTSASIQEVNMVKNSYRQPTLGWYQHYAKEVFCL